MTDHLSSTGISFDRIAYAYDNYAMHPPEVAARVGETIARVAGPGALVLEIGIGTGRIATPVEDAGCRVVGIDISTQMMEQARAKGFARLAQASLLQLPFRDAAFDAVMVTHVLHHIDDWRAALAEAMRVLRPGGALIQGNDWLDPQSCVRRMRGVLRNAVIELNPGMKPPGAGAAFTQVLGKLGGETGAEVIAASWHVHSSPQIVIDRMASREHQETWPLDDALLNASVERVRAFASAEFPDLASEQTFERRFVLTVTRKRTV